MKMTTAAVKTLFSNNGMSTDLPLAPISLEQYSRFIRMADRWFGSSSTEELMDCFFDPEGEPVAPGCEDSLSHYRFRFSSWEEFEEE